MRTPLHLPTIVEDDYRIDSAGVILLGFWERHRDESPPLKTSGLGQQTACCVNAKVFHLVVKAK